MARRGRPRESERDPLIRVAELVIQEHMTFSAAAQAVGLKFETSEQEHQVEYSEEFRDLLHSLGFRFYGRVGAHPMLTKEVMVGVLFEAVKRLQERNQDDKVTAPVELISKLKGYLEKGSQVEPIIGHLTQADIDALRAQVREAEAKKVDETLVLVPGPSGKPS